MQELSIPKDIVGAAKDSPVEFFQYTTAEDDENTKIRFTTNAINLLIEGNKEIITPESSTLIGNDKIILIQSGYCLMANRTSSNRIYSSMLLFFSDEILQEFIRSNSIKMEHEKNGLNKMYTTISYDSYLKNYVQSLVFLNKQIEPISSALKKTKLFELLHYLTDRYGSSVLQLFSHAVDYSTSFTQIIANNLNNRLTIDQLAFLCNMSTSKFKRTFQEHYHTSPAKYLKSKRLENSAILLKTQPVTPSELYEDAGFESLSAFIHSFKQQFGTTPKQYQLRNE